MMTMYIISRLSEIIKWNNRLHIHLNVQKLHITFEIGIDFRKKHIKTILEYSGILTQHL